jgi:hypothetical protein
MSKLLNLFGLKNEEGKIKRVKLKTNDVSSLDDINIITTIKSAINDNLEGWETNLDTGVNSISLSKKSGDVGLKISFYYKFEDDFQLSNIYLTYHYSLACKRHSLTTSTYTQTTLTNKSLITTEILDFFYEIYHMECNNLNNFSKIQMDLKNKVLEEVIGKANLRDTKLDDLLNNK